MWCVFRASKSGMKEAIPDQTRSPICCVCNQHAGRHWPCGETPRWLTGGRCPSRSSGSPVVRSGDRGRGVSPEPHTQTDRQTDLNWTQTETETDWLTATLFIDGNENYDSTSDSFLRFSNAILPFLRSASILMASQHGRLSTRLPPILWTFLSKNEYSHRVNPQLVQIYRIWANKKKMCMKRKRKRPLEENAQKIYCHFQSGRCNWK